MTRRSSPQAIDKARAIGIAKDMRLALWQYRWGISDRQLCQLWSLKENDLRRIVRAGLDLPFGSATMQHYADQLASLNLRMEQALAREPVNTMAARLRVGELVMALTVRQMQGRVA